MGLYKFLLVGLWPLHILAAVALTVALVFLGFTADSVDFAGEIGQAVLVYAFFLVGIAVAISGKMHLHVNDR